MAPLPVSGLVTSRQIAVSSPGDVDISVLLVIRIERNRTTFFLFAGRVTR